MNGLKGGGSGMDAIDTYNAIKHINGMTEESALKVYQAVTPEPVEEKPTRLKTITARELMSTTFAPLVQAVDGLICEGLTFIVSPSKIGKSWLVLLMAYCESEGAPFLGRKTNKSRVIYFALEDSQRRLKNRMQTLNAAVASDGLSFVTKAQALSTGFSEQLEQWLAAEPATPALVIIDTFQMIRGMSKAGANLYQDDYAVVGGLKALADKYHASFVCVHHTNRNKFAADAFDKVSGSNGIMAAADTTLLIERERNSDTATVKFEGRDVFGKDFVIRTTNGRWEMENEDAAAFTDAQRYEAEPLVQLFRLLMTEAQDRGGRWTYSNLQSKGLELLGFQPFVDGRDCALKLNGGLADEIRRNDNILVECGINTTGGKGIRLQKVKPATSFQTAMDTSPTQHT